MAYDKNKTQPATRKGWWLVVRMELPRLISHFRISPLVSDYPPTIDPPPRGVAKRIARSRLVAIRVY